MVDARIGEAGKTAFKPCAGTNIGPWAVSLFVDNLTNKKALLSDTGALSANISILDRVATNQPRTIGADLSYKF